MKWTTRLDGRQYVYAIALIFISSTVSASTIQINYDYYEMQGWSTHTPTSGLPTSFYDSGSIFDLPPDTFYRLIAPRVDALLYYGFSNGLFMVRQHATYDDDCNCDPSENAYTRASWTVNFSVEGTGAELLSHFSLQYPLNSLLFLDLTTNSIIVSGSGIPNPRIGGSDWFSLIDGHTYLLSITTLQTGWGLDIETVATTKFLADNISVQEPSTFILLCTGLAGLGFTRKKRRATRHPSTN